MPRFIIFLPENLEVIERTYLYGAIECYQDVVVFYVLRTGKDGCDKETPIGLIGQSVQSVEIAKHFVNIHFEDGMYEVSSIKADSEDSNLIGIPLIVLYDHSAFLACEYFPGDFKELPNYCVILEGKLRQSILKKASTNTFISFLCWILKGLNAVGTTCEKISPVLKYSSIGLQLSLLLQRTKWTLQSVIDYQFVTIKLGNLLLAMMIDVLLGILILSSITSLISVEEFPHIFLWTAENVVMSLRKLLDWLVGSPAGFKLNLAFNHILMQFFMFHIEIWWLFLASLSPGLGVVFNVFTIFGHLGITIQAAILSDLLGLVSFHIYCIYAYAARLYNIQVEGLFSLWRLFLGRKKNPLRGRVDSCQYSADQLFVGTLLFTIALFLLPTTLLYYIVFTSFRLVIVGFGGILNKLRKYLHALPVYSSILWYFGAHKISLELRMEPDINLSSPGATVVRLKRVPTDYSTTVKNFVPDCVEFPEKSSNSISHFMRGLIRGDLLYPV